MWLPILRDAALQAAPQDEGSAKRKSKARKLHLLHPAPLRHEQRHRDPAVLFGLPHPHLPEARFDWTLLALTTTTSIAGAQWGALFMARRVKSLTLTRVFAAALVLLALQRIFALLG